MSYFRREHEIARCGTIFPSEKWFFRRKNDLAGSRFVFPSEK